ncbi:hypothetical protein [Streptomyces griseomycini]|uniref:Uncharacterized protein n=1 Tax=Streptomyces griseomycini TaxID=66895 RepID=A0A7W7PWF6_9ACTN|nr:hypothetical protein [Streptomyces griseomycini]MBB4902529.1 hypothetical protein [Streptomyces griseomycini]
MTTQRTPRALAREAAGLCLTALGVLGVLVALGALHWAAALNAVMIGLIVAGWLITPKPDAPRRVHVLRWAVCGVGYSGVTACAFVLYAPAGWLYIALAVTAAGLWLATHESEGA